MAGTTRSVIRHRRTQPPALSAIRVWSGCVYPEDLYFDGVPYRHLNSTTLPAIGPGQWWFDYANHLICFHDNPSGHTVETSAVSRLLADRQTTLRSNTWRWKSSPACIPPQRSVSAGVVTH